MVPVPPQLPQALLCSDMKRSAPFGSAIRAAKVERQRGVIAVLLRSRWVSERSFQGARFVLSDLGKATSVRPSDNERNPAKWGDV